MKKFDNRNETFNKRLKSFLLALALCFYLLFFVLLVDSFGVYSKYHGENPVTVVAGESKDIEILMLRADSEAKIKGEILDNEDIASIIDKSNEYSVNAGFNTPVNVRIKIPEKAYKEVIRYDLTFKFTDITPNPSKEGSVKFLGASTISVPVVIMPRDSYLGKTGEESILKAPALRSEKGIGLLIFWVMILITLAGIVVVLYVLIKGQGAKVF